MKIINKLWLGIFFLILFSPLGVFIPMISKAGVAWGEWSGEEIKELIGYIPKGLEKLSSIWKSPIPDYNFRIWESKGLVFSSFAYIISAIFGVIMVALLCYLLSKYLVSKKNDD